MGPAFDLGSLGKIDAPGSDGLSHNLRVRPILSGHGREAAMRAEKLKIYDILKGILGTVRQQTLSRFSAPQITRHFVQSQSIATLGFDQTRQCLHLEYYNGILYRVDGVSIHKYRRLTDAQDFDRTFRQVISAHHPMTRIGYVFPVYR